MGGRRKLEWRQSEVSVYVGGEISVSRNQRTGEPIRLKSLTSARDLVAVFRCRTVNDSNP